MELMDLRNKMSTAFLLLNAIFVVVIFVLQMNTETLYIPWPCGDTKMDPLGFIFMMMFGVIMFIQIVGMLVHRTSTFFHIMSTTVVNCFWHKKDDKDNVTDMVELAKRMGKLDYDEQMTMSTVGGRSTMQSMMDDGGDDIKSDKYARKTIIKIQRKTKKRVALRPDVNEAFSKRLTKLDEIDNDLGIDEVQRKVCTPNEICFQLLQNYEQCCSIFPREVKSLISISAAI